MRLWRLSIAEALKSSLMITQFCFLLLALYCFASSVVHKTCFLANRFLMLDRIYPSSSPGNMGTHIFFDVFS
jgi:hypothetical protein